MKRICALILMWMLWMAAAAQAKAPGFHVTKKFMIGGEGGWDYIQYDPNGKRLFVAHNNRVLIIDAESGRQTGEIAAQGAHGIALVPELKRGFFTNGRAGTVTAFDANTLKPIRDIKAGENPDAIIYDEFSRRVLVMNGRSKELMAIDPQQMKVVAALPLGGKLEYAAAGQGHIYVNVESTAEIAVVDSKGLKAVRRWKLSSCEDPTGLALDAKRGHLFCACSNAKLLVVNSNSGAVEATLHTGQGTDGVVFDAALNLAFVSNGEGTLTAIGEANGRYEVVDNVPTERSARTLALDSNSHTIYLPAQCKGGFCILVVAK